MAQEQEAITISPDVDVQAIEAEIIFDPSDPGAAQKGTRKKGPSRRRNRADTRSKDTSGTARVAGRRSGAAPMGSTLHPANELFLEVLGEEILLTTHADQLNILGQTFRPIFCGHVAEVTDGFITLDPAIIKMSNAPFFRFPTPLSFAIEKISAFVPFDCSIRFPIP